MRAEFPALRAQPQVAYLDSATTTQLPQQVVDAVAACLTDGSASPGRGGYPWATRWDRVVSAVRAQVASLVNAEEPADIEFTAGASDALRRVQYDWALDVLADGDEIMYCPDDHAATVTPWLRLREVLARRGVRIELVPYRRADITSRVEIAPRTRLVVVSHVHSLYGTTADVARLRAQLDPSVALCADCSQSAGHIPVDVQKLGADFAILSGHKMFAPPGIGVLYRAPWTRDRHRVPDHIGTANVPAIVGLGSAIDFLDRVGLDRISTHNAMLTRHLVDQLDGASGIELVGAAGSIVSVRIPGVRPTDAGFVFADASVYVRTGGHCVSGADADAIRISSHVYNTLDDIDRAAEVLTTIATEG